MLSKINKQCFTVFLLLSFIFYFNPGSLQAKEEKEEKDKEINTTTIEPSSAASESFFEELPPASLRCRFGGLFAKVFPGDHKATSTENAILIDGNSRKLGVRERLNIDDKDDIGVAEIYLEVLDVSNDDLINLLVLKKTVATRKALIDILLKRTLPEGDIIVKTREDVNSFSTLFAKISRVGSTTFEGNQFFLVDGDMKIVIPPEKLELIGLDHEENEPGVMRCKFKGCPVVKTNLERLKDEFEVNIEDIIGGEEDSSDDDL